MPHNTVVDIEHRTMGQVAYEAYWQGWGVGCLAWESLTTPERRAWHTVARVMRATVQAALKD